MPGRFGALFLRHPLLSWPTLLLGRHDSRRVLQQDPALRISIVIRTPSAPHNRPAAMSCIQLRAAPTMRAAAPPTSASTPARASLRLAIPRAPGGHYHLAAPLPGLPCHRRRGPGPAAAAGRGAAGARGGAAAGGSRQQPGRRAARRPDGGQGPAHRHCHWRHLHHLRGAWRSAGECAGLLRDVLLRGNALATSAGVPGPTQPAPLVPAVPRSCLSTSTHPSITTPPLRPRRSSTLGSSPSWTCAAARCCRRRPRRLGREAAVLLAVHAPRFCSIAGDYLQLCACHL